MTLEVFSNLNDSMIYYMTGQGTSAFVFFGQPGRVTTTAGAGVEGCCPSRALPTTTRSVQEPSAAIDYSAAEPGCGRASRASSPVLFLMPFISASHGPVMLPGEMGAGDKPGAGCRRSETLKRK